LKKLLVVFPLSPMHHLSEKVWLCFQVHLLCLVEKRERDAKQKVHILYKDNVSAIKNFIASYWWIRYGEAFRKVYCLFLHPHFCFFSTKQVEI
jgi:hypothetical protein